MRYPNSRYGNPAELHFYAQGMTKKELAKMLKRSEKSVSNWLSGRAKIPFWVPELLRLRQIEHTEMMRQMRIEPIRKRFGLVSGNTIKFNLPARGQKQV